MWIVRLALRRPYTFVVVALLLVVLGVVTVQRMPTDIFPNIDIPVVTVIWSYTGIAPEEMEKRIVTVNERAITTTVNDIEHIESQSLHGVGVIKVFFQPERQDRGGGGPGHRDLADRCCASCRPASTPPLIIRYSASNVPILQLALTSETLPEQQLYDFGQ